MRVSDTPQGTLDWHRERIGKITASKVHLLMQKGKNKNDVFSVQGLGHIYKLISERNLNPEILNNDVLFDEYIYQNNITSKAMQWGKDQEANARNLYAKLRGVEVYEVGFCIHPTIDNFGSSADGWHNEPVTLEIKSLCPEKFEMFRDLVKDNASLLKVSPEYFYQCMAHMLCYESKCTDFIVYNPFQKKPIHIVEILPDKEVFEEMEERVLLTDARIKEKQI